jgi:hypothetical protein
MSVLTPNICLPPPVAAMLLIASVEDGLRAMRCLLRASHAAARTEDARRRREALPAAKESSAMTHESTAAAPDKRQSDGTRGHTVRDVARRYRVGEDKVRGWIARGELKAINTATVLCSRPRWVILPEALTEFERRRAGGPPPKPAPRRKRPVTVDFYPD